MQSICQGSLVSASEAMVTELLHKKHPCSLQGPSSQLELSSIVPSLLLSQIMLLTKIVAIVPTFLPQSAISFTPPLTWLEGKVFFSCCTLLIKFEF